MAVANALPLSLTGREDPRQQVLHFLQDRTILLERESDEYKQLYKKRTAKEIF